jgi:hypothetical protein
MAWDSKATLIAIEHKLDGHKLRRMPRRNRPTENRKRPFATSLTRQNVLESVPLLWGRLLGNKECGGTIALVNRVGPGSRIDAIEAIERTSP